jgi:hypothetical protein
VILVALDHGHPSGNEGRRPRRVVGDVDLLLPQLVALDVRLVHHVEPELVAELLPKGFVRVVRGAHRVEVVLLHQPDVLEHALA